MRNGLETKNLTKIYESEAGPVKAVDGVSVGIEHGKFVALVGPSGSGKTTMLAMLAGLLTPSEGQMYIDDADLGQMSERELTAFRRQKIGFTFQSNNLVPYLTALENVELMLRLNGTLDKKNKERARNLLVRLGLEDRLKNLPSQLSGGQRQRVAIARSLIHNPAVVLADEPTASLDTERAYQVVQTFANLIHEEGRIGIMVTHDLRMCQYVDKVVEMVDGKLQRVVTDRDEIYEMAAVPRPDEDNAIEADSQQKSAPKDRRQGGTKLNPVPSLP